jgi:hypothetical protein
LIELPRILRSHGNSAPRAFSFGSDREFLAQMAHHFVPNISAAVNPQKPESPNFPDFQ